MRIDLPGLQQALEQGYSEYRRNAEGAVRSQRFIRPVHNFCSRELARLGIPEEWLVPHPRHGGYVHPSLEHLARRFRSQVHKRLNSAAHASLRRQLLADLDSAVSRMRTRKLSVLGGYLPKQVDVLAIIEDSGPVLGISVKSQMSSIVKNTTNRFEEYVGDATNLHTRYPMLVLGFLLILPVCSETFHADGAHGRAASDRQPVGSSGRPGGDQWRTWELRGNGTCCR